MCGDNWDSKSPGGGGGLHPFCWAGPNAHTVRVGARGEGGGEAGQSGGTWGEGERVSLEEADSISAGRCSQVSSTQGGTGSVLGMHQCLGLA